LNHRQSLLWIPMLFCLFGSQALANTNQNPYILSDSMDGIWIGRYLDVLEDPTGAFTIEEILKKSDGEFSRLDRDSANFGFSRSVFWLKFSVNNIQDENINWVFEWDYPLVDYLDLHETENGKILQSFITGNTNGFSSRNTSYNGFSFHLDTPPGSTRTYYLRIASDITILVLAKAWSHDLFEQATETKYWYYGLYFGILLVMMSYNFFLYLSIRETVYLYYVLYLLGMWLTQLSNHGFAFQYLWPDSPAWNINSIFVFTSFSLLFGINFSRKFLNSPVHVPILDKYMAFFCKLSLILLIAPFIVNPMLMAQILNIMLIVVFLLLGAGVVVWSRGYRPARFYVIAWSFFLLGLTIFGLMNIGLIGVNVYTQYAYMVGSVVEVVLLSLALADKINIMREEKEEAQSKYLKTSMNIPGVVYQFMIRNDGSFTFPFVSSLSAELVGFNAADIQNDPNLFFKNIYKEDHEPFLKSIETSASTMNVWEHLFRYVMPDGNIKWFHGKSIPHFLPTGEPLWNGVILDITEIKNAEIEIEKRDRMLKDALLKSKEELEIKVLERTSELRIANIELEKAKEIAENATIVKDKFVSLVSHDLRSPLAGIMGMLDIFESNMASKIDDKQRTEIVSRVKNTSKSLLKMVDQLLDIGRLQSGKIKLNKKYTDMKLLVSMHVDHLLYAAKEKKIVIVNEIPSDMRLLLDSDLTGEVIQNLVSNAVKFCSAGDVISIYRPNGNHSSIAVSDTGIGLDKTIIDDLFKHEIKTTTFGTSGEKGTGLGLPYCMDIMKAHNGTIYVKPNSPKGTIFHIEFPVIKEVIIVADDQDVQRRMVIEQLKKITDADIMEASTGKEVLKIMNEVTPMLIITDIQMPGMDGLEVIKTIRQNNDFRDIPVIVNSALSSDDNHNGDKTDIRKMVLELGANDFIAKPVIPEDFIPKVKRFIV